MNNFLLDCKSKAKTRKWKEERIHAARIMKELWDDSDFGKLESTSQNLGDQAARLEKTMGDGRVAMSEIIA